MDRVSTRRTTRATARNVDQNTGQQTSLAVTTRKRTKDNEATSKTSASTTAPNTRKRKALGDNTNAEKKKSNKKGDIGKGKKQSKPEPKPEPKSKTKATGTRGAGSSTSMRVVVEIPIRRRRPSQPKNEATVATSVIDPSANKSTGQVPNAIPIRTTETAAPPQIQGLVDIRERSSPRAQPPTMITRSSPETTTRSPLLEPEDREGEPPTKRRRSSTSDQADTVARSPTAPAQEQDNPFEIGLQSETVGNGLELVSAQPWDDLDAEDENDPLMVAEYVVEIFEYMKELELQTMPSSIYINSQPELEWHMRGILMDWLIQVHARFKLLPETLFIATNLVDRFLSARVVSLVKLQLVGMTGLLIAAKYEEIMPPAIHDFLRVADSQYDETEILNAEKYMLRILDWDLRFPNPMNWLRRASKADEYDTHTRTMAKFLIEISVVEERLLKYVPSMLAAAGLWLSRLILERPEWNANLEHYSGYSEIKILSCANEMVNFLLRPIQHESLWRKYSSKKYFKCAVYARNWAETRWPPDPRRTSAELDEEEGEGAEADLAAALPILREQISSKAAQK